MKNLYTVEEIDFFFEKAKSIKELYQVCDALKSTRELGLMTNEVSKVVAKLSLLRFAELTEMM